ncbi:MAG TPA: hypothetical protein GXX46_00990 [Peptococcaceae bacterium]|nr:hypothetical protein [Peptococcaceae bacterium]
MGKNNQTKNFFGLSCHGERGYVSLLILLVLFFLSSVGYEVLAKAGSQERIIRYEAQRVKALYLADSGLEWARSQLAQDPSWPGGLKVLNSGKIEVEVSKKDDEEEYTIYSRSQCEGAIQGRYGVLAWDEKGVLVLLRYGELFE